MSGDVRRDWPDDYINKVICGDCLEVMKGIPDEAVDLIIIDPPFSSGARTDAGKSIRKSMVRAKRWENDWFSHDNLNTFGFIFLMRLVFVEFHRILKAGNHLYSFIDWRQLPNLMGIVESTGFIQNNLIVWDKGHFGMGLDYRNQHELIVFASKGKQREANYHNLGNVLQVKREDNYFHPTEKPEALLQKFVLQSSDEGDVVLDCFLGSGPSARAAKRTQRNFIGIEINPDYCKIAEEGLTQGIL